MFDHDMRVALRTVIRANSDSWDAADAVMGYLRTEDGGS